MPIGGVRRVMVIKQKPSCSKVLSLWNERHNMTRPHFVGCGDDKSWDALLYLIHDYEFMPGFIRALLHVSMLCFVVGVPLCSAACTQ